MRLRWDKSITRSLGLTLLILLILLLTPGVPTSFALPVRADGGDAADENLRIEDLVEGMVRRSGLLDVYLDADEGRVLLELPPASPETGEVGRFLYGEGLTAGLGSNPIGLDRGQLGETRLLVFRQVGGRLLLEQPNLAYRALSDDPDERRAVRESFATSILWAAEPLASEPDGRWLVDFTPFLLRDAHGIARTLERSEQGSFKLDPDRSVVDLVHCLAFPDNLEFETLQTFSGEAPGNHVRDVTPTPESISLVMHHSLVRLPDSGYQPREFDPRAGSFAIEFRDYAAPLDAPTERRWIVRHRLEKTDPSKDRSRVKHPIVYYVDSGAPEPVRSALIDGASWWSAAFDTAGFVDGFQVRLLPEGVHPLDVRYNVIEWVHRSTRGWSYGGGMVDPRTGERIKGHVNLGSLRVRQDRLIFEGLAGVDLTGSGHADDPVELALARIRQLAAHEVGHTLGLAHNFAASTYAGRASVMDYPAPFVRIDQDGGLDFSNAYGVGVGAWDLHAIRWAYSQFPQGADETAELEAIVRDGLDRKLSFLSDADARPAGAAHPLANLWDNGGDPIEELVEVLAVRRTALGAFGERNIAPGRPLALLQEVLAPIYFFHRYQLTAAAKSIGGLDYTYAVRGDGQPTVRPVAADRQRRALDLLAGLLTPESVELPEALVGRLYPRPFGYGPNRELFRSRTSPVFDETGAAATATALVVDELLQPERAARLVQQHARNEGDPGLNEVVDRLTGSPFDPVDEWSLHRRLLAGVIRQTIVRGLIELSALPSAAPEARAGARRGLIESVDKLEALAAVTAGQERADAQRLQAEIVRFVQRPFQDSEDYGAPEPPPGSPIGSHETAVAGCSLGPGGL